MFQEKSVDNTLYEKIWSTKFPLGVGGGGGAKLLAAHSLLKMILYLRSGLVTSMTADTPFNLITSLI